MKRLLALSFILCLFVEGLYPKAGELNIYASGLRVNSVNEETNEVSINYFLNCDADALEFQLINSTGVIKTVAITGSSNLTKGQHNNVAIDLSEVTVGGSYKWALKATRTSVNSYTKVTDSSTPYQFFGGRGVAVDNSFESEYFGNVYVTNFNIGEGAGDYISRLTQTGVYALDAGLNMINENAYQGGLTWGDNSGIQWAIARPCVGSDGTIYITSGSATNSGVWMMNPADPSTFTAVFGGSHSATGTTKQGSTIIHNSILDCYVEGNGDSRKLYTYDLTTASNGGDIFRYDIGTLASPWTAAPSATIYSDATNENKIQGGDCSIAPDGNGGWWICQYRNGTGSAAIPCLIHTTNGTIDYNSGTTIKTTQQGGLAISKDGLTLAIGTDKSSIIIYDVAYAANNTPTLTKRTTIGWETGRNAKGLAFDVANNLYVVDNAKELFAAFATKGAGEFTTPAPSAQKIAISRPLAGTYKIGGSQADYALLYDAIADISSLGISADVNLLICDNLTETKNIGFANNSDHTITIRPDADAERVITFTQSSDNPDGPSGAFIIGAPFDLPDMSSIPTRNVVIDGLASEGATHKMTIQVSSTFGSNAGPIVFYGGITNTVLKNCKIINNLAGNTYRAHCITVRSTASAYPDGVIIEKNTISTTASGYACPIYINGSSSTSNPPKNTIIRNNEITGKRDLILFNYCKNITIENNIFRIKGSNGVLGKGIGYYTGTAQSSGNIIIRKNQFVELLTNNGYDERGFIAIEAMSGGDWTIENNLFTGFGPSANTRKGELIGIKTGGTPSSIKIRHNTMILPAFTKTYTSPDLLSGFPVSLIYTAGGTPTIENNILASFETTCNNSLIRGNLNANVKNNVFYHAGGNAYVVDGAASAQAFNNLASTYQSTNKWQQIEFETGSYIPTSTYLNNINLGVEHLDGFNYDIEGNTRNFPTRAGCYDPAWSITLDQTENNDAVLTDFDNILVDATLKRPFIADGGWYTLILPFDVTAGQIAEAFGAGTEVAVLQNSRWKSADEMYLNFQKQATIEAGVPCLIKPTETIASEVTFHDVTIDKELTEIETDLVNMIGFYKPTTITLDDDNYYLGNSNLLYEYNTEYASSYATPNGFRAYFHFDFTPPAGCAARVVFHEDTTTGIEESPETQAPAATKVIREGQLLIIRDGKEYNAQGQLVR